MDVTENMTIDENGNSLDINNLNVNCITNSNQKFSIDNEGNIIANTITLKGGNGNIDYDIIFEKLYPVGSIYMSVNNANPGTLFGGVWQTWGAGRVPVGVDTNDTSFNIVEKLGGSKYLQDHNHVLQGGNGNLYFASGTEAIWINKPGDTQSPYFGYAGDIVGDDGLAITTGNSGNLQPYITCYMWKRVS